MPVDQSKGVYGDDEDGKGEFEFETTWEDPHGMMLKTACCCCICAIDGDMKDLMQVQQKGVCIWAEGGCSCACCQCMDESSEALACTQGTGICKCLSMTDPEKSLVCCNVGEKGVCCCCVTGTSSGRCCDPCGAPESCVKVLTQVFCIHSRSAIPCDEDVPFEIGCCGFMCKEAEKADGGHE